MASETTDEKAVAKWAGKDLQMESGQGIQLKTMGDAWDFAKMIKKAGISKMSEAEILISMQTGSELGFSPMRSLQACPVVKQRMFLEGKAGLALVMSKGVYDARLSSPMVGSRGEGDELTGYCRSWRQGWDAPRETIFTIQDAKVANLTGKDTPWKTYPKRMVMWRAVGFHLDEYYSDITHGLPLMQNADGYSAKVEPVQVSSEEPGTGGPDGLLQSLIEPEVVTPEVVEEGAEAAEEPARGTEIDGSAGEASDPGITQIIGATDEEVAEILYVEPEENVVPIPEGESAMAAAKTVTRGQLVFDSADTYPVADDSNGGECCGAPDCARVPHPVSLPHVTVGGEEFRLVGEPGYVEP